MPRGASTICVASRVDEPTPVLSFAGIPSGSQVLDDDGPLLTRRPDARVGDRLSLDALKIAPDARLLVTGPNGAGKSTLLGLLAGRLAPDAGTGGATQGLRVALLDQDVRWDDPSATPRGAVRPHARGAAGRGVPARRASGCSPSATSTARSGGCRSGSSGAPRSR